MFTLNEERRFHQREAWSRNQPAGPWETNACPWQTINAPELSLTFMKELCKNFLLESFLSREIERAFHRQMPTGTHDWYEAVVQVPI